MSLFKSKKVDMTAKGPTETLQDIQTEFNQLIFKLGDLHYRKSMTTEHLSILNNEITSIVKTCDELGAKGKKVRERIEAEMKATMSKGEVKNEAGA